MDARAWIVLGVSGAYLVGCLVIGLWPSSKSSDSAAGFVAGDRALGGLLMYFITGATIFSSFTFLGLPGWAATRGAASFYILSYGILGFVPFYFLGTRAARLGRRFGYVTQAEMVAGRFGAPYLALAFALVSLIAFVPYLALQIQGAGLMLNAVSGGAIGVRLGGAAVYAVVAIERRVLLEFHQDGRSVREIARALGSPEGTVKSDLHRARRRLAERLDKERPDA